MEGALPHGRAEIHCKFLHNIIRQYLFESAESTDMIPTKSSATTRFQVSDWAEELKTVRT